MKINELAFTSLVRRKSRSLTLLALLVLLTTSLVGMTGVRSMLTGVTPSRSGPVFDPGAQVSDQNSQIPKPLGTQDEAFRTLVSSTTATLTLLFTIVAATAILSLLLVEIFWIRGRRSEIGIFLAIGKSKSWIAKLFTIETAILTAISLVFSVLILLIMMPIIGNHIGNSLGIQVATFWSPHVVASLSSAFIVFIALAAGLAPILARPPRAILSSLE